MSSKIRSLFESWRDAMERHEERHRPSGFHIAFSDRIDGLNPQAWDAVTAQSSLFLSRRYLAVLEQFAPSKIRTRYALLQREGTPVAAVAAQALEFQAGDFLDPKQKALQALRKFPARSLVCGNLLSWGQHGVAFAPGEDPALLWAGIADALYRIRRADRLFGSIDVVMLKDFPADAPDAAALRRFSYRPMETEPDMQLSIPSSWKSYDDYLASLAGKYRKGVKQIFSEVEKSGCRIERVTDWSRIAKEAYELYLQVHHKATLRPVTLAPGYLPGLATALGENLRTACVFASDGALIGFVVTIRDGETAIGYYLGVDTVWNEKTSVYHRLLHAVIEDGIALGCRRISFGRTALDAKARLGAKPVPTMIWTRHRIPAVNLVMRNLLGAVPHAQAPERNPFSAS